MSALFKILAYGSLKSARCFEIFNNTQVGNFSQEFPRLWMVKVKVKILPRVSLLPQLDVAFVSNFHNSLFDFRFYKSNTLLSFCFGFTNLFVF